MSRKLLVLLSIFIHFAKAFHFDEFYIMTSEEGIDNVIVNPKFMTQNRRQARATSEDPDLEKTIRKKLFSSSVYPLEIQDWILLLEVNDYLTFGDEFERWVDGDDEQKIENNEETCKFYSGKVLNVDDSKAIVTVCDTSYYGFLEIEGNSYFIEPTSAPKGAHIVYKAKLPDKDKVLKQKVGRRGKERRCVDCEGSQRFDLSQDTSLDGVNFNFGEEDAMTERIERTSTEKVVRKIKKHDDDDVGYFVDATWQTRPYPSATSYRTTERWLELALAVDHTVINFYGKDKIRRYIMALMNIVSVIYKDSSLDADIHLVLSRLIFFYNKKDLLIKKGNAKKSLEAVNRWNYHLIGSLPKKEKPHDIAVWLTREYIGGPSGYAPVAGVCDRSRSTALNKDEGLASAFIIAHEMAHILGLSHDGDLKAGNKCEKEVQKGTIMAPIVTATFNRFVWSSCSKEEFRHLIKYWTCLLNPPTSKNLLENSEPSYAFSMDEQCRMEYGNGYSMCKAFELIDPCSHLWCGHENSSMYCITKKGPPIEGTQCGFDKWCIDGFCQNVDGRLSGRIGAPRDGGWGSWSAWTNCSKSCGYGVQQKHRQCNNPTPEHGGADCQGKSTATKICKNDTPCWQQPGTDMRLQICSTLNTGDNEDWLPYDTEEENLICQSRCVNWDTGEIKNGEQLPDGTQCSYENEHNICIEGKCHNLGCDGGENSTMSEDKCGECGGSGRSCVNTNLVFRKTLRKELTKLITLPRLSRHVSMSVKSNVIITSSMFLVIKKKTEKLYKLLSKATGFAEHSKEQISNESTLVLAGTALKPGRTPNTLTLNSNGPLNTDIVVLMSCPAKYINNIEIEFQMNYTLPMAIAAAPERYIWLMSKCNCDLQYTRPLCVDTLLENQTVSEDKCKPNKIIYFSDAECENIRCEYRWVTGKWEYCSATCGIKGISHRQVYCVSSNIDDENLKEKPWMYMVEPNKCSNEKPSQTKACNRVPCPVNWIEEPWTECSTSCGLGISIKPMKCSAGNNIRDCGPPPPAPWRKCFVPCPHKRCNKDRSPYCAIDILKRYCVLDEFEKLCCQSCNKSLKE